MRRVTRTLYKLSELKPKVRAKVLERYIDINTMHDWWDSVYEDAERAGIAITEFDIDYRTIKGKLETGISPSIRSVLKDHGELCNTYKVALEYQTKVQAWELETRLLNIQDDSAMPALEEIEHGYLNKMLACYLSILRDELTHQSSDEAIADALEANDYEFTKDGEDA